MRCAVWILCTTLSTGVEVSSTLRQCGQTTFKVWANPRSSMGPPQLGQLSAFALTTMGLTGRSSCGPALEQAQVLEVQVVELDGTSEEQERWILRIVDGGEIAAVVRRSAKTMSCLSQYSKGSSPWTPW